MYGLMRLADKSFDVGIDFDPDIFEFDESVERINKEGCFSLEKISSFLPQFLALSYFLLNHFWIAT